MATGAPSPGTYAQEGHEGRCARCGRKVELRIVARNAFTDEPVYRWVAVRKTKAAPIPVECPASATSFQHKTKGPHRLETHSADGSPLSPR